MSTKNYSKKPSLFRNKGNLKSSPRGFFSRTEDLQLSFQFQTHTTQSVNDVLVSFRSSKSLEKVSGVTLTAVHFGSFLNFAQLPYTAKLKIETKCAAVKVTPLTEVALVVRLIRTHSTVHL